MFQQLILTGRLTQDAKLSFTSGGTALAEFSVVTSKPVKQQDGTFQEKSTFHNRIKLWGKRAEGLGQYLKKGLVVQVVAELEYGDYQKDGVKHYTTDIRVNNIVLMPSGGGNKQQQPKSAPGFPSQPQNQNAKPAQNAAPAAQSASNDPFDEPDF